MLNYLTSLNITITVIFPIAVIFFLMMFYIYYIRVLRPERGTTEWIEMKKDADERKLTFFSQRYPVEKSDALPIILIAAVFLIFAIFNLGSTTPVDVMAEIETPTDGRTHFDNLYFDEIYFVRTAVEHIESIHPYEWTHPPLGKNIIAASILIFGENPFGWRLIGSVCGVIMLLVMYILIKNMFGKTPVAVCGTLLLGFDFMRLVQSRIGTIDTYAVLFILLSYFFMYRYITTERDAPFGKSVLPLALSGLFFGLSFTVKWIGFYAGAGLLIIYVIRQVQLWHYYNLNKKPGFASYFFNTILFSFLFFVIVPALIYYVNYIPYGLARGMSIQGGMLWSADYFNMVWQNQESMFHYHSTLDATHGGSSFWWQWLFNIKPILYVNSYVEGMRASYAAFGNPVLYWGGLAAIIAVTIRIISYKDGKALFIVIGYLAQLLPWVAVTRVVFAYHYLPSTLFLVLAVAYIFNTIFEREKPGYKNYVYGFTAVTGAVFLIFYPALSGVYLPYWYYDVFIKWLPSWPF